MTARLDTSLDDRFRTALAELPATLQSAAYTAWDQLRVALHALPDTPAGWPRQAARVFALSDFCVRTCVRSPDLLVELLNENAFVMPVRADTLAARITTATAHHQDRKTFDTALRRERSRLFLILAWRDLNNLADLDEVVSALSAFADAVLAAALRHHDERLSALHGHPRAALACLAMGKLGGNELNFSSDIDLIYAYTEDGETDGPHPQSHFEFYARLVQGVTASLSEKTADGFVFRVDLRLRPNGGSGALALPFEAMESYYQVHGREWERYALTKARPLDAAAVTLCDLLTPFVYRRYLDYGALAALRDLKARIVRELHRKGAERNLKLGPGGIREIEFICAVFQLIRGGREPGLRERSTRRVLVTLSDSGLLDPGEARALDAAYVFLRNTEHRLQMMEDRQTQVLPSDPLEQTRLAVGMNYPDWSSFMTALEEHRTAVSRLFDAVLALPGDPDADPLAALWPEGLDSAEATTLLAEAGYPDTREVLRQLRAHRGAAAFNALSAQGHERLTRLMPRLIATCGRSAAPDLALSRLLRLVETVARRSAYLALLTERPEALDRLATLAAASPWVMNEINRHPLLLDELVTGRDLDESFDRAALDSRLADRMREGMLNEAEGDAEAAMERLREFHHAELLHIAAADLANMISGDEVARRLSLLAETALGAALDQARATLHARYGWPQSEGRPAPFAIIAFGRLGSQEMNYGSDLDLVFLHTLPPGQTVTGLAPEAGDLSGEAFFARLAQRLIHLLSTRTAGGLLYPVDTRLRPSGRAGLLVTSLEGFRQYQADHAWTWEHQALIRARPVAGDRVLCAAFESLRAMILARVRDPLPLAAEVREMRERMRAQTRPLPPETGEFDVRRARGGRIDIEFMVQYAVLKAAHAHPVLLTERGTSSLLAALGQEDVITKETAARLAHWHAHLSRVESRARLEDRPPCLTAAETGDEAAFALAVWNQMLEQEGN